MNKKQCLCAILAGLSLLNLSCGTGSGYIESTSSLTDTAPTGETTADPLADNLPEKNYGGVDFNLLVRTERLYYLEADEENGETLNDAVYKRNLEVENRFNVNLVYTDIASDKNLFSKAVSSSVMADDEGYDIICPDYWWGLDTEGYFYDLNALDYIDFNKPWWSGQWNKNAAINGICYMSTGYLCLDLLRNVEVVYFNKDLVKKYNLDDPYELVKSGGWTIEKAIEMGMEVAGDDNGDTLIDDNDRFGIYMNIHALRGLYHSLGATLVSKKQDGTLEINVMNEKYLRINDIIYNLRNNKTLSLYRSDSTVDFTTTLAYKPFSNNNLLFTFFALTAVEAMRSSDINLGIVPVPKLDSDDGYISHNYGCTLSAIPVNAPDIERSAIILEALNAESYKNVTPSYYETVLKSKLTRDDESREMLDLIFENIDFDFGFIHSNKIGGIEGTMFGGDNANVASTYASNEETYKQNLAKLIEAYESLE